MRSFPVWRLQYQAGRGIMESVMAIPFFEEDVYG